MTKLTTFALSMFAASAAFAGSSKGPVEVPEIDALAGIAAVAVVGTVVALIWERRK